MKKLLCIFLALIMATAALPLAVFADDTVSYAPPVADGDFVEPTVGEITVTHTPVLYYALDTSAYLSVEEAAYQLAIQMANRVESPSVKVASTNTDSSAVWNEIWNLAFEHTGDPKLGSSLMWTGCRGGINRDLSGEITYYTMTYHVTYYTTAEQEAELDAAVNKLLADLNIHTLSEYEKVFAIYKYMCDNIVYDYTDNPLRYTPYSALIYKTSVCNGYALLFYRLALEAGLECMYITGDAGGYHAWNIVKISDHYYNLDATWDAEKSHGDYWYFLKCSANFNMHTSDEEFNTEEFKAKYPISPTDYVYDKEFLIINGTLYQYNGIGGDVVIPDNVKTIDGAFYGCYNLTGIKIPNSVTEIGNYAFASCSGLSSVTIPDSVTSIGNNAFDMCSGLTQVTLPSNLTHLGNKAFRWCSSLSSVTIPETVTSVADETFAETKLNFITFLSPTTEIADIDFAIPSSAVICGYRGSTAEAYATQYGRTFVDLETNALASGTCGDNAIWKIDTNGTLIISGTGKLKNSYGNEPWKDYRKYIIKAVIEEGITEINNYTVWACSNLREVYIPASVSNIESRAFYNVYSLERIIVSDASEHYVAIDGVLFDKSLTQLIQYPRKKTDSSYIIPNGVETITDYAFSQNHSISSVRIPDTVKTIGTFAFHYCYSFSEFNLPDSVTNIQTYAFASCGMIESVIVPESVETLGDGVFDSCSGMGKIVFRSPDTVIFDSERTLPAETVIYGFENSTAQAYAEKYGRTFAKLLDGGAFIGDLDDSLSVDKNDAIYLLYSVLFGESQYPLNQTCDFNADGSVDKNDAIYLLYHALFGATSYPLN